MLLGIYNRHVYKYTAKIKREFESLEYITFYVRNYKKVCRHFWSNQSFVFSNDILNANVVESANIANEMIFMKYLSVCSSRGISKQYQIILLLCKKYYAKMLCENEYTLYVRYHNLSVSSDKVLI